MTTQFWTPSGGLIKTAKVMRERHPQDFYPTQQEAADAAIRNIENLNWYPNAYPERILDAGAGGGVWAEAIKKLWPKAEIDGAELRNEVVPTANYDRWFVGNYIAKRGERFHMPILPVYDLICGNPPYSVAQAFVERSLALVREGGYVYFLFTASFLGSYTRYKTLWTKTPPMKVIIFSERSSFIDSGEKKGKTDAREYAMYLWRKDYRGTTELSWLSWKQKNKKQKETLL